MKTLNPHLRPPGRRCPLSPCQSAGLVCRCRNGPWPLGNQDGGREPPTPPQGLGEHASNHSLNQSVNVLFLNKAHLEVYLGVLGLAVGSEVLVAECAAIW